jgi:hypothetical protein
MSENEDGEETELFHTELSGLAIRYQCDLGLRGTQFEFRLRNWQKLTDFLYFFQYSEANAALTLQIVIIPSILIFFRSRPCNFERYVKHAKLK